MDPYIGDLDLQNVHMGTLGKFIAERRQAGRKSKTINHALGLVRHILNLAADEWIDESGLTWLERAPKIKLPPVTDGRDPYPVSWEEQRTLFQHLPDYLAEMALFKVNTGLREQEVVRLQWDWEIPVPELGTAVFLIPRRMTKNGEERLVVLNRIAASVVDRQRGNHPLRVFTRNGRPVKHINGSTWRRARIDAALELARTQGGCDFIRVESSGRYETLVWTIRGKRHGEAKPFFLRYCVADFDAERKQRGLKSILENDRRNYDLKSSR